LRNLVIVLVLAIFVAGGVFYSVNRGRGMEYSTTSAEAYDLFLKGDQAYNSFQWQRAEHLLQKALELDPSFAMAQAALTDVYAAWSNSEAFKESMTTADSLATLLPDETERMVVQLRLSRYNKQGHARQDSLLARLELSVPNHPIVLVTKALRAMEDQDIDLAKATWDQLLKIDPNYARAYNWLGYLEANQGNYDQAISHLRKYAFLSPDLANPHDSMGEILSYIGRYEEAEREFIQALEVQPDFFHSLLHLARVYLEQGKIEKGVDLLEQTRSQIAGTKYEYEVDALLVATYYSNKLEKECDMACVRFFSNHPESFDGGFFRAIHLTGHGKYDEAQAVFDSLMTVAAEWKYFKETERGTMHYQRIKHTFNAVNAELLGELDTAAEEWRLCLANTVGIPPHEKLTWKTSYSEVLLKLERNEEAFAQAEQILAINPRLIHPLLVYISAGTALGRFDEARVAMANLDKILEQADPDLPAKEQAAALRAVLAKHPSS